MRPRGLVLGGSRPAWLVASRAASGCNPGSVEVERRLKLVQRITVVFPVLLGVGAFAFLEMTAPEPETRASLERVRALRVIIVEPLEWLCNAPTFTAAASVWSFAIARTKPSRAVRLA